MEMHKIDALPALIIGRRDDSGVQAIYFDCTPWAEIYPAMSEYRLEMSINGVRFAPLRQSYDNGLLTWTVSEQDTAVAGAGRYEITATGTDGQRKTSASATVYVDERIPGTALGVPPDYVAPLLDRIAEIVAGAGGGNVSPEQIQQAVESYLDENPIKIDEKDPTVPDWAKQPGKPAYTAQEVGAMPANAEIVDNTARQGVLGNAEAISQLSEEMGKKQPAGSYVKTVNNTEPDENGNVQVDVGGTAGEAVLYINQELTLEQRAQARKNIGAMAASGESKELVYLDFFSGDLSIKNTGSLSGLIYNTELDPTPPTGSTSPGFTQLKRGNTVNVSLLDYSTYTFQLIVVSCPYVLEDYSLTRPTQSEKYKYTSFYTTEQNCVQLYDSGWVYGGKASYTSESDNTLFFIRWRNKPYTALTADDHAAMKELIRVEIDMPSINYLSSNLGVSNANRVLVTDEEGNIVPGVSAIDGSAMPDYWREYLDDKLPEIRSKLVANGASADAFAFFTDHHIGAKDGYANANNTKYIIDYVRQHTPIESVFHGGDVLCTVGGQTREQAMYWLWQFHDQYVKGRNVYSVLGNHEASTQFDTDGSLISFDESYATLFKPMEDEVNLDKKRYYYVDNESQKIRYIVLAIESGTFPTDTEQKEWLISTLNAIEEGWTVVLFDHIGIVSVLNTILRDYINRAAGTHSETGTTWDFTSAKGTLACLICGHEHSDSDELRDGVRIIHVTTDAVGVLSDDTEMTERSKGNITEQAVELFFINTSTRTIDTIRLGYGENRSWTY